jgi:hypothetical protein
MLRSTSEPTEGNHRAKLANRLRALHGNIDETIAMVRLAVAITLAWRIEVVALRRTEKKWETVSPA